MECRTRLVNFTRDRWRLVLKFSVNGMVRDLTRHGHHPWTTCPDINPLTVVKSSNHCPMPLRLCDYGNHLASMIALDVLSVSMIVGWECIRASRVNWRFYKGHNTVHVFADGLDSIRKSWLCRHLRYFDQSFLDSIINTAGPVKWEFALHFSSHKD